MAKDTGVPSSPFIEVTDPGTVKYVFTIALKQQLPISFWLKNQKIKFEEKLSGFNKERIFVELPHSIETNKWDQAVKETESDTGYFLLGTVKIVRTIFFFKLRIDHRQIRTIKLYRPIQVYKLQRRNSIRIRLSPIQHHLARTKLFHQPEMMCRMFDVGAKGLALGIDPQKKSLFRVGMKVESLSFSLLEKPVTCSGIVRYITDAKDESRRNISKIGIEFTDMGNFAKEILTTFVILESKNIFSSLE